MTNNFVFIVPSYNNMDWVELNIKSIKSQRYESWRVVYVDDASTDGSLEKAKRLSGNSSKFQFLRNDRNLGPAASRHRAYQQAEDDEILCMLDGDDWLPHESVLGTINDMYDRGFEATYGSYVWFLKGRTEVKIIPLPSHTDWFCRHLRTMRARLIKDIPMSHLKMDGEWIRCCSDMAESNWVEGKTKAAFVRELTYVYNRDNSARYPLSYYRTGEMDDYKTRVREHVKSKSPGAPDKP